MELGLAADPYPEYARMRAAGALVPAGPGTWAVPRHREVTALLSDPRVSHRFPDAFRRYAVGDGPTADLLQRIVSSQEPPAHGPARARLIGTLHSGLSEEWWAWAQARIAARVAALRPRFDAVTDLAVPLAIELGTRLFGLTDEATADAAILGRAFTALRLSEADRAASDAAVLRARTQIGDRAAGPAQVPAHVDDLVFLVFTAIEMLSATVATCCAVLPHHPDQLARLRAEPGLAPTAVAEILRFDSPTQGTARLVTTTLEVDGRVLRPGRILFLLLGSANHDGTVFADPDRLDITRDPNPHLSFGGGPYRCLGAALAQRVGAAVLRSLFTGTTELSAPEPPRRYPAETFCRSYASVPIVAA
jgi:cytochrome P450